MSTKWHPWVPPREVSFPFLPPQLFAISLLPLPPTSNPGSEEWDMNAPTSAAPVQGLAAASFQLLGERGFRESCQALPRSHGGEHEGCSASSRSLGHKGAAKEAAGGGGGADNIWTHPRRSASPHAVSAGLGPFGAETPLLSSARVQGAEPLAGVGSGRRCARGSVPGLLPAGLGESLLGGSCQGRRGSGCRACSSARGSLPEPAAELQSSSWREGMAEKPPDGF